MVEKQLQIMFHSDLVPNVSTLRAKSEGEMSIGMSEGVGRAREVPNERYSKVKIIILPATPVELKQVEEFLTLYAKKSELDPAAIQCTRMKAMSRIAFPRR
jgi:predicted ATPase with chaperone activity